MVENKNKILVPLEPTEKMKCAYWELLGENEDGPHPTIVWRIMLAALKEEES